MKNAGILHQDDGFVLEYGNTLGEKNTMRLEVFTHAGAIPEAKALLGINADKHNTGGAQWNVE